MFRRFIAITFALIFTVVTGSVYAQVPPVVVTFVYCQFNPTTDTFEVCATESTEPPVNIQPGDLCVSALALLFQEGFESFPAMAVVTAPPAQSKFLAGPQGRQAPCLPDDTELFQLPNGSQAKLVLAIPLVKVNNFDPPPPSD